MIKFSQKFIALCVGLLMCAGLMVMLEAPAPADAANRLTISVSCNVSQATLDNYVQQISKRYNIDPNEIYIKYPDGTVVKYKPGTPTTPKPAPVPTPTPTPAPQPSPEPAPSPVSMSADEQKMFNLVNQERAKVGLPALKANGELLKLARLKAQDMINKGYFSHTSPTYGSPFDMMKAAGVSYRYAGENLAGAYSVDTAHTNLMNSSGHRANILNTNFKEVGIGIVNGGPYGKMYVQMFIG
ncbi:Cysteine-rich secretory protein family protein [Sporotomaculum syntrophicum]|uniref:Cysteine-rich secretory protein family protein n=1 Tax=Sporotomaculum syntrophicum TaxID=182264 RepID=A0A9D3AWK6_9FIRM|nr:CAP domain-containing protein [Sporotomaculum syntrophicum]KAF1083907.1 Cysteine-rich secretory protein family protein [Sporotomaculum syntrophicum]